MKFPPHKNEKKKKVENRLPNAVRIFRIFNYIFRINQRTRDFLNYN